MPRILFLRFKHFYINAVRQAGEGGEGIPQAIVKDRQLLDASVEAAAWGVVPGLGTILARRRCPDLVLHELDIDVCEPLFRKAWAIIAEHSPIVEPRSFHEGFVDLSGCSSRHVTAEALPGEILWRIRFECGLESEWGGGEDSWIARLACGENRWIAPHEEEELTRRLPLARLGMPFELLERLSRYNLRTLYELRHVPRSFLQSHVQWPLADLNPFLLRMTTPLKPLFPPPEIRAREDLDEESDAELRRAMHALAVAASAQLALCHREAGILRVALTTRSETKRIECKLAKPVSSVVALENALERIIVAEKTRRLRRIEWELLRLTPLIEQQGDLWTRTSSDGEKLEQIDRARQTLERKYGAAVLQTASDYAREAPPRFAQLIYAKRGLPLP